jgi:hypothetical protein
MGNFALSTIVLATLCGVISLIIIMTISTLMKSFRLRNLTKDIHGKTRLSKLGRSQHIVPKAPIFRGRNETLYETTSVSEQTNMVFYPTSEGRINSKGKQTNS